jgi:hypothetical protein
VGGGGDVGAEVGAVGRMKGVELVMLLELGLEFVLVRVFCASKGRV